MNRPRVKTIAGKDKITKIGLIVKLIIANNRPTIIMSLSLFSIVISLLKKLAAIHSPKLQTSHLVRKRVNKLTICQIVP